MEKQARKSLTVRAVLVLTLITATTSALAYVPTVSAELQGTGGHDAITVVDKFDTTLNKLG